MSETGKQSPLGVNVQGAILDNKGLTINPVAASFKGSSKINGIATPGIPNVGGSGYTFGSLVNDTVLRLHTWAINDAYHRNLVARTSTSDVYDNLINVGKGIIPALGNAMPPTYDTDDPAGVWSTTAVKYGLQKGVNPSLPGPATSGYALTSNTDQGQQATWYPYTGVSDHTIGGNPNTSITQWGYIRLHALQAWYEFNWNGEEIDWPNPEYKEFLSSFLTSDSFVNNSNNNIFPMHNSEDFLDGVYSNMNDLISADIAGVSLSYRNFGTDLINLGNAIDLSLIGSFGLPSSLIQVLFKQGALTEEIVYLLLSVGLSSDEIDEIATGQASTITLKTQQLIYGSFLLVSGPPLVDILAVLKCRTAGIETLADLLNVKKLFPLSYETLTVPIYNESRGPTNSKTYYLIYNNTDVNSQLSSPALSTIVGSQLPIGVSVIDTDSLRENDIRESPKGFGSYLRNILPKSIATAAGAFAYTMQQVRNINQCNIEVFAQAVRSLETISGLPLTNGTSIPTDKVSSNTSLGYTALGSGIYGTYTMSDLFGCMSGLPYPWQLIYQRILQLQTSALHNIYRENFLAVTWEKAYCTITSTPYFVNIQQYRAPGTLSEEDPGQPRIDDLFYTIEIEPGSFGGGYGRGGATTPTVSISPNNCGASVSVSMGTNQDAAASNGGGSFGRLTISINNGNPVLYGTAVNSDNNDPPDQTSGPDAPPNETITIQAPPTSTLPITNGAIATNGSNTTGDVYNSTSAPTPGTAGWPDMNTVVQNYINQANAEIALIRQRNPEVSRILNTYWDICGIQLKREQRSRYTAMPPVAVIPTDSSTVVRKDYFLNLYPTSQYAFTDAIPELAQDTKPHMSAQTLEAISDLSIIGGQSIVALMRESRNKNRLAEAGIILDNTMDSELNELEVKTLTTNGVVRDSTAGSTLGYTMPSWLSNKSSTNENLYPVPQGVITDGLFKQASAFAQGDITPLIENQDDPIINTLVPVGTTEIPAGQISLDPVIISVPLEVNSAIPPNLDSSYASSTMLPSAISVTEAIDNIIKCNCECWIE
jgi:hypothetical protein